MSQFGHSLSSTKTIFYVEKFQLSHPPFSDRYLEAFFYEDGTRTEILKKITHLTDYSKRILFVQGAEGLGKTSLLRYRLQQGKNHWRVCFFNARDFANPAKLIEKLFVDFRLKFTSENPESNSASLNEQLESLKQTGITPVLIIDDIDELNPGLIPMLQSLIQSQNGQTPLVRLILAGNDIPKYLQDIIPREEEKSAIKYLPLPPFSEKETAAYIKYRLVQSGYRHVEPFNKNTLAKIYLGSKGFPKIINQLADSVMNQYAQTAGDKQNLLPVSDDTNKKLKIAAAALGALVIISLLFLVLDTNPSKEANKLVTENKAGEQLPLALPPATTETKITRKKIKEMQVVVPENKQIKPSAEKPLLPIKNNNQTKIIDIKPTVGANKPKPSTITGLNPVAETKPALIAKPKPESKPEPIPKAKPVARVKPATNSNMQWLNAQNKLNYTLQLVGTGRKSAALRFIRRHKIQIHAHIIKSYRKGKVWYSVVYDSYPTVKEAKKGIKHLPHSLRNINPWIRRFQELQNH